MSIPVTNQPNFGSLPMPGMFPPTQNQPNFENDEIIIKELTRHQIVQTQCLSLATGDPCCVWLCAYCEAVETMNHFEKGNVEGTLSAGEKAIDKSDTSKCFVATLNFIGEMIPIVCCVGSCITASL